MTVYRIRNPRPEWSLSLSSGEDEVKGIEYSLPVTQSDELSKYLSMKIDMDEFSSDILTFWENNASEFSRLARQIHSIPATSAAVERQFNRRSVRDEMV